MALPIKPATPVIKIFLYFIRFTDSTKGVAKPDFIRFFLYDSSKFLPNKSEYFPVPPGLPSLPKNDLINHIFDVDKSYI